MPTQSDESITYSQAAPCDRGPVQTVHLLAAHLMAAIKLKAMAHLRYKALTQGDAPNALGF